MRTRIVHAQLKEEEGSGKDLITIAPYLSHHLPFPNLSIYIYHQLANCSNLPSAVKMKTSRVRVHRNSVYITAISRITSWRANEQSIVLTPHRKPPKTRCSKNFGVRNGGKKNKAYRYLDRGRRREKDIRFEGEK